MGSVWFRLPRSVSLILMLMGLGLTVRLLPYLAPIHAQDLLQDQQAVTLRDRHGLLLGTLLSRDQEHTMAVALDQISPLLIQAVLAAEDGRFYDHGALDLRAIARAVLEAVAARQVVSGASTITMQLARMLHPSPRTWVGKLQEIWDSWRLTAGMSKDDILMAYLNRLPMGGNIYGVEAAARIYFGTSARELNLAQASLLAALPNDPNHLNPYDHWSALKRRQRYVLAQMVQDGYLTSAQADRAAMTAVALQPRQQGILAAPHFLFWLARQLPPQHPSQIRTTLDLPLQTFVETQVQQVLQSLTVHNVHQAAVLVVDNHSGEVLAYVGSPDYFADTQLGRNDGVQALRQPGSTLKPFVYELALERRVIRPNTVLADVPTYYAIPGAQLYSPSDYSETFQGPVRVRVALANSLNIPAVRVLERLGVPVFLERLRHLGFEHLTHSPDYYGLGLVLGSGEVSLWELTRAYVTLANQGQALPLVATRAVALPSASPPQPMPQAATWALITHMLSDPHARAKAFGVTSLLSLPFPAAVKTGTSSDYRDTWTVGFTTDYTVAVWVGNFNGDRMLQVSGITGAAPLWHRIMLHLHEHQEPEAFALPDGLVQRPVCALSGRRPTPACAAVVQEYFYPEDLSTYEQQPDTFYQGTGASTEGNAYQLNLPDEYNEWLTRQPYSISSEAGLKIIAPQNGDTFLLYPTASANPGSQRLEFKLAAESQTAVEWQLNGQPLAGQAGSSVFWPLRPGTWRLTAKRGKDQDQVQFQVISATDLPRSPRRGFAITPNR
ncbi:penicillin-binding protein [Neosynechococcus sphagnicola sy1]|uniref:Penicillin-binding protein n=1 Tax=Neosynechococcus sphagnicola sy1 TaxID=1497020 RepID=A0A098TPZ3_9CYAN|nr:penicillin-binding protein [Neosynechococcus sphagnicola sy1]